MEGGELFAKISERTTPFTEQGLFENFFFLFINFYKVSISCFKIPVEVAKIMHQICAAVKHLHTMRIVHRGKN